MAADPNDEAQWRAEFEQFGERAFGILFMTDFLLSQSASLPSVGWELRRKNDFTVKSAAFSI